MSLKIFYKRRTHRYYIVVKHGRFSFTAVDKVFINALSYMYNELLLWDVTGYEASLFHTMVYLDYGIVL